MKHASATFAATPLTSSGDSRHLLTTLIGDGRPLLAVGSLLLLVAGVIAIALAASGYFLPHDAATIGMQAPELCAHFDCHVVYFMIHDRVAFGGALIACGLLYLWLVNFPLADQQRWAWWTLLLSNCAGFLSFLSYVGYGYLDSWHGVAALGMLAIFSSGLLYSHRQIKWSQVSLIPRWRQLRWNSVSLGWILLLLLAAGLIGGGLVITLVGATAVFVPQDFAYMQATLAQLHELSHHLVPVIAHDRAGFGGALWATGIALMGMLLFATPSHHLVQVIGWAGWIGFGCAVGIHWLVGYTDVTHLLPAYAGLWVLASGLWLVQGEFKPKPVAIGV
ncbi:MAG TPA: hypothetical protein P5121_04890 [Caldilineaceae bacterium]|nr:hypothetical protein [Caldilineaceae bacterium]